MYSLVNSNFNRGYNPNNKQNILCDIKRLLTSRDTTAQSKACGYLIEVISKYNCNSNERSVIVQYLLNNDITVFLCETISNMDFSLFRSVLQCVRLLWREVCFFTDEHAAHILTAVTRALAHYIATEAFSAVDICMHFICDLLNGVKSFKTTPSLSYQSAYCIEQLLACFTVLADRVRGKASSILSSAVVLQALISYQPADLDLKSTVATELVEVLEKWIELLIAGLNHIALVGDDGNVDMFLAVTCELGMDMMRLAHVLEKCKEPRNFIHKILKDDQEVSVLEQISLKLRRTIVQAMNQLVVFVKDNLQAIDTEEYGVFLKTLLNFMCENANTDTGPEFCDLLFSNGYLIMLPKTQIVRNDLTIRKVSTQVLGEMLKILAAKYLNVKDNDNIDNCLQDIHMGSVEFQYGIEKPQNVGLQLQKNQPYGLLIYIYFYCQSSENPEECTAPLLPYLIEHILRLPKNVKPPGYAIKALWLVFAMSTVSNSSMDTLEQKLYLEKATHRLVTMLLPEPEIYYTHNPAILFWVFTSLRIPNYVRLQMSQWFKTENTLPENLMRETAVWKLIFNVLVQSKDIDIVTNCMEALNNCIEVGDENSKDEFATLIWSLLPDILSNALINSNNIDNICYILDIAISELPSEIGESTCLKISVLISALYSKNTSDFKDKELKYHYEFTCLKLCLLLLDVSGVQNDSKILLTYLNRKGFLPCVLTAINSADKKVACTALQLLTCIIFYFTRNNYQPKSVLEIKTDLIIKSLRQDSYNERGVCLQQLIYIILSSGSSTPIVLTYDLDISPQQIQQCDALRALLLRIQTMLCCQVSKNQASNGWRTLNSIFKHAIVYKNDCNLVATLMSQTWTLVLTRFQLTQNDTDEFIAFVQNWLNLLNITIKKGRESRLCGFTKYSPVRRTLNMLNNNFSAGQDSNDKILGVVREILK